MKEFAGVFKTLCRAKEIQIYSTISELKTAFAEATKKSLKGILYCHMKTYGYQYFHKFFYFATTLKSRKSLIDGLDTERCEDFQFLSFLYSKPLREYRKPKVKIGERVRTSKYDWPPSKSFEPQFLRAVFESDANISRKPPTCTKKDKQDEILRSRKSWSKSINNGIVHRRVGFYSTYTTISRQYQQPFYKHFAGLFESGGPMGGCNFQSIIQIDVAKD